MKTTWTGIHRGHQHEVTGKFEGHRCPGDGQPAVFKRLSQKFQYRPWKFRKFIQKKHPVVGQLNFPRSGDAASSDQTRLGNRVMRKTERPVYDQRRGVVEKPGNAVNFRAFQSLFKTQLRKDRSQPPGQHRLARTRRTEHQQIMGSRRGHFKRPFDMLLSLDVLEIFAKDFPFLKSPRGL